MVFKFLFKPEAEIELKTSSCVVTGAMLPVKIRLATREEVKARELRVELTGKEVYYVSEVRRTSKGQTTRVVKKTSEIASVVKKLVENAVFTQGTEQQWDTSLQLPSDAPPTCRGKVVDIAWKLKAVLDVPGRPDKRYEMPLQVLSPRASEITFLTAEKSFNDVVLNLRVPSAVAAGKSVSGQLKLQVKDKLSCQGIRVELVREEDAGARRAKEVIAKAVILGSASFNQQESPSFDFTLDVPAEVPPTSVAFRSNLHWKIKAIIDRKLKTDYSVEQEVRVYKRA